MGYSFTDEQQPKAQYKFVDEQKPSIIDDFMMPTLKAIPPVVTHTVASMAQMPFAGLVASTIGLKTLYDTGNLDISLNAANNVLEDSQQALNNAYLKTPQIKESAKAVSTKLYSPIGLFNKGIEMSGQGWGEIGKLTGIPYAEPTLNTMGQGAAMFGLLKAGEAAELRLNADLGGLDTYLSEEPGKPYSITPNNAPRITPESARYQFLDENAPTKLPEPEAPIVNRVGNPYRTVADAQTIMENKGLADTHEVIPYQDGYALQRKGAQALVQDLFDPLGLNKEFVTPEETLDKGTLYKPQTIDGSAVPGNNFKEGIGRYKDGDVVGRISPEHAEEIQKLGFDTTESNVVIPQKSINHIWEIHGKQLSSEDINYLEKTIKEPTEILPNLSTDKSPGRDASVLMVRNDGKNYISVVEIKKGAQDNELWNFWKMGEKNGNNYLKKYREEKARILQPGGTTVDIPHIPHNTSADAVGKPEGLSGSQVDNSSLLRGNIAPWAGSVNKNSLANDSGIATIQPTGGNISDAAREQLEKIVNGQSNTRESGGIPSLKREQSEALQGLNQTFRNEGYNIKNSGTLLKEIDNYLSSSDLPLRQKAQIKKNIVDGIHKNSEASKLFPPRYINGE